MAPFSRSRLAWAAVIAAAVASLGHALPVWFDLTEHFRLHIAVGALGLGVAALALQQRWPAAGLAVVCAANLAIVAPELFDRPPAPAPDAPVLKVMSLNLLWRNEHLDLVRQLIEAEQPDLVMLQEVVPAAAALLAPLLPHALVTGRDSWPALLSRYPVEPIALDLWRGIAARVGTPQGPVDVLAAHVARPLPVWEIRLRPRQLARAAAFAAERTVPVIVAGDFNGASWSMALRRFRADAGLVLASDVRPSWPAFLWPLGIPIDQVLVRGFGVVEARTGPAVGSDHLPVIVRLAAASTPSPGTAPGTGR